MEKIEKIRLEIERHTNVSKKLFSVADGVGYVGKIITTGGIALLMVGGVAAIGADVAAQLASRKRRKFVSLQREARVNNNKVIKKDE